MLRLLSTTFVLFPVAAFAVFSNSSLPPQPSETTTVCQGGQVWDSLAEACVDPSSHALNDTDRMDAVRELAYAGRTDDAMRVLESLENANTDMAMTYRGFLTRVSGDWEAAKSHYYAALAVNPDNLLARSYLGQGYVLAGDLVAAKAELSEIRARGGRQSWPEVSLRMAIEGGPIAAY